MARARGRHPSTFHLREESLAGFSRGALSIDELLVPETTTDFGPDGASLRTNVWVASDTRTKFRRGCRASGSRTGFKMETLTSANFRVCVSGSRSRDQMAIYRFWMQTNDAQKSFAKVLQIRPFAFRFASKKIEILVYFLQMERL